MRYRLALGTATAALAAGVIAVLAIALFTPGATPTATASSGLSTQDLSAVTPQNLASALAGAGVAISNVTFTGATAGAGSFTGGAGIIGTTVPGSGGIEGGVVLSSGDVASVVGPNTLESTTTSNGTLGDSDLDALSGASTFDAAILEFDFVPNADTVFFQYVFGSEEYNEFVNTEFNDVFGFFVNGVNCATVPGPTGAEPVAINLINNGNPFGTTPNSHPELYINNDVVSGSPFNTELDGLTHVLTCEASVITGETNHMKLAIADTSDSALDSDVFIEAGSFSTNQPPTPTPTPTLAVQLDCGDDRGGLVNADGVSVSADPSEGFAGDPFTVHIISPDFDQDSQEVQLIWDGDNPPNTTSGTVVGTGSIPSDEDGVIPGQIPNDATGGSHDLTVCWLNSSEETWFYQILAYFVDTPPTHTPSPSPTSTSTSTPTPTDTPTPTPTHSPSPPPVTPVPPPAPPSETFYDTDVIQTGVGGLRGNGSGTIDLTGLTGTVTKAFLYWHGPEVFLGNNPTSIQSLGGDRNANVTFDGTPITGQNIGISSDNCWGYQESDAYRADVTSLMHGNGAYQLADFEKGDAEANGASLIVFYDDGNPANNSDVVLFEGNDSNAPNPYDADGWNVLLSGINYSGGPATIALHVSDGQTFDDDALFFNGTQVAPIGPNFSGNSVPADQNSAETYAGGLWDIQYYNVGPYLSQGATSLDVTTGAFDDCLSLIVAAISLPAGAAPGQPSPTPTLPPTEPPTHTPTPTPTPVETINHPTVTPTPTPSPSPTVGEPATSTPIVTASPTPTATATPPPTPTNPPTALPATSTPASTPTPVANSSVATPRIIIPQPTPTPLRLTATPTTTPRPTSTPRPQSSPSATVLSASIAPHDTTAPGSIITNGGNSGRPEFAQSVLTPGGLSGDIGVISMNLALGLGTLMLLVLSSELFNKTVEENHDTLKRWLKPVFGPIETLFAKIGDNWNSAAGGSGIGKIGPPLAVLVVAGLIYGVLEPGFGFNDKSIVMFLSVVITVGIVTYFYNGGQILVSNRLFSVDGAIRMFPIGVLVAAVCVLLTRLDGFQPGIIYGFIASAIFLSDTEMNEEQTGKIIFYPALALLALCLLSWFLISPFRDFATDHSSLWAALPETVAAGVFVGALEGTFFQMIPIRYMDGHKVWSWNKAAWLLVAGITAFMFWAILLHPQSSSMSSVSHGTPAVAIVAMVICFVLSVSFYAFFRLRGPEEALVEAA